LEKKKRRKKGKEGIQGMSRVTQPHKHLATKKQQTATNRSTGKAVGRWRLMRGRREGTGARRRWQFRWASLSLPPPSAIAA